MELETAVVVVREACVKQRNVCPWIMLPRCIVFLVLSNDRMSKTKNG